MLWQTPAIALTAQALLFGVILRPGVQQWAKSIACCLSAAVGFAAWQLLIKHRAQEVAHAAWLGEVERDLGLRRVHGKPADIEIKPTTCWPSNWSSFWVWAILLAAFVLTSVGVLVGG